MNAPRLYLAPLRGVTLRTFRNAFNRHFHGIDLAVSPFIPTVNSPKVKPSLLKDVDLSLEQAMPIIPQVIGNSPDDMVVMCRSLMDAGHSEINWNLGCPHRPVTRKKRGSGLLPHPDMIKNVLDKVCSIDELRFSVKVRLGLKDPDELLALCATLNDYPLSEIIIHPRTGSQMYDGEVDLPRFGQCLEALELPVVYNGDIRVLSDFERLKERFPDVQGWMIGRGLIANPFLPEEIIGREDSNLSRDARLRSFLDELLDEYSKELYGPAHILGRMKEIWRYLAPALCDGDKLLTKIKRSTSVEAYRRIVKAAELLAADDAVILSEAEGSQAV